MARSPLDHDHGGLYGVGAEPVQGQSDRQRAVRAYDDGRGRGLGAGGSEFLYRIDLFTCSLVISRATCSWPAVSWSTLRAVCS